MRDLLNVSRSSSSSTQSYAAYRRLTMVNNDVLVEFFVRDTSMLSDSYLSQFGIVRNSYYGKINKRVQALVPMSRLEQLAGDGNVNWVQPPARPYADVTSEGVALTYANTYQNHVPAYDGTGVKVAIVDLGFSGYQAKLGTELPATVTALSFRADNDITGGGQVHGTACAEVVHDMAPGAQLYLLNFSSLSELSNAINYCVSNGIKVISHSIGWTDISFYDGTGDLQTIVDYATNNGIMWCNSAGNQQNRHWDGTFSDPDANGWENFSGNDEDININLAANTGATLSLTWNEWPIAASDYDLFLYNNSGTLVASSTNVQNGTQPPAEELYYVPSTTGTYHIKIKKNSGNAVRLALFCFEYDFNEYNVTARSLLDPAPVANAFTVGAANVGTDIIENFSSLGPTEDGRLKPDISAPDGNSNSVYGTFYGTSSACPHTAGASALLISQDNTRTVAQLKSILKQNSVDLGPAGPDDSYGAGRLRMPDITDPTTPPTLTSTYVPSGWSTSSSVTMNWSASTDTWSGVAGYSYTWNNSATTPTDSNVKTTNTSYNTSLSDAGNWYFHLRALDNAGNPSSDTVFGPVKIDVTPPTTPSVVIATPQVNHWTNNSAVSLTWNSFDATSGLMGYVTAIDHNQGTIINSGALSATASLSENLASGIWYVHIASRDSAGNWSTTTTYGPIEIDTIAPLAPTIVTLEPSPHVWTRDDTLAVSWHDTDALSGIEGYSYSVDTLASSVPTGLWFVTSFTQILADGQSWYFHLRAVDSAGNWSPVYTAGPFYINTVPPSAPVILFSSLSTSTWTPKNIDTVRWKYTPANSGVKGTLGFNWLWDHTAHTVPDSVVRGSADSAVSQLLADGTWYFHLRAEDSTGSWSPSVDYGPFEIDHISPTGVFTINTNAAQTSNPLVTLNVTVTDAGSGPAQMQFSNDGTTWSPLQPYVRSVTNWDLRLFGGNDSGGVKTVYGRALDNAGNISSTFGDSIKYVPLSVNEPSAPAQFALVVYPNPASATAQVQWNAAPGARIYITDVLGRIASTVSANNAAGFVTIDLHAAPSGVYTVHLVAPTGSVSTQLLIAR
ncbi:MAG TPA: S8 family peptidase [Candidatus Kapabacteria bacterium]|nr:S8 family peptidase [Candidatus Kapabacteria bacterium]